MATQIREMVCITCPIGCRMELTIEDGKVAAVQHNSCKRGISYAEQEFYDPRRMVTATAFVTGGIVTRVPVRSSEPLPMAQIDAALEAIYDLRLQAPLDLGQVVIEDVAGSGVDIITTRKLPLPSIG